jgi:hypothetical protein
MRRKTLYEVEIKSNALIRDGKKGFITYFEGGQKKTIVKNVMALYPQYTHPEDNPVVEITPISRADYKNRLNGEQIVQKRHLIKGEGHVMQVEDYETLGN